MASFSNCGSSLFLSFGSLVWPHNEAGTLLRILVALNSLVLGSLVFSSFLRDMVMVTRDSFHSVAFLFMGAMPSTGSVTDLFGGDSAAFFKRSFPGSLIGSGERTAMHKFRGLRHPRLVPLPSEAPAAALPVP